MIQATELQNILIQRRMSASDSEIQDIIRQMDYHGNMKINYSEFLAATIDVKLFLTDSKLKAIFQQFDTDNSGFVTAENIKLAMQKLGKQMSLTEVEQMIDQHDQTGDKKLSYQEFKNIFFGGKEIEDQAMP